ncbi:sugar ABC transporter substrate-binding protein [Pelagibacterium flavum]|uniref:Sugar ABC transporter substrate-binding protein n=1 Tax=Pelagibacterium flavum TaxID=2984530 RepID=A0ABY6IMW3_9HYPH|nr:sugar ABC transporter substrate-binding protein [Pelagibacterium sp. YIM 151497]UYQ71920.1 sugar ABC transporter substrate-binding protein [Pelagibacterium sp. YIM 151497]
MKLRSIIIGSCSLFALAAGAQAQSLTIATVNNGDMIRMQGLSDRFTEQTGIDLEWVTLEENVLRQRVTTDIATGGGQYDVMTIGAYETPIWAAQGWLAPLDDLGDDYNADDLIPAVREALSVDGTQYASPFYAESAMIMYRTDLFEEAGLEMPQEPTWEFIGEAARAITDRDNEIYGICLRGKAGWGENMAFITALANSMGGRWFDMDWEPQFDSPEWNEALTYYVDLMTDAGPPGASSNGFNENLALFQQGKCGMWMDATVAASFVSNPDESQVADSVGYALFPTNGEFDNHGNWLWVWSLAVPASSQNVDEAKQFIEWATSEAYLEMVAEEEGWANVPPGTRTSLYENPAYIEAAPFAEITLEAIQSANTTNSSVQDVPYAGGQFVAIPEFQGIGTSVGQIFSAALAGQVGVDQALDQAQQTARMEMDRAGYYR